MFKTIAVGLDGREGGRDALSLADGWCCSTAARPSSCASSPRTTPRDGGG
jgi:hypothetical protein